jgi:hypothetical protein
MMNTVILSGTQGISSKQLINALQPERRRKGMSDVGVRFYIYVMTSQR